MRSPFAADSAFMTEMGDLEELVAYLLRSSRLSPSEGRRLVFEVLSFLSETPDDYVRRRHLSLQSNGLTNVQIFAQLAQEMAQWRFRAPAYSERQIRRMVYG
jgi:hypothetical protein